jgi:hypothetical protein
VYEVSEQRADRALWDELERGAPELGETDDLSGTVDVLTMHERDRRALSAFRHYVTELWRRTLRRRSQRDGFTWERMTKLVADWLPPPRILHPWPDERFDVRHPR